MSDAHEKQIASIFMEPANLLDRWVRKAKDYAYVVEYQHPVFESYGGSHQKRHQRRYADLAIASRRLDYLLAKYPVEKAFILNFPLDIEHYRQQAMRSHVQCLSCGGRNIEVKPNAKLTIGPG